MSVLIPTPRNDAKAFAFQRAFLLDTSHTTFVNIIYVQSDAILQQLQERKIYNDSNQTFAAGSCLVVDMKAQDEEECLQYTMDDISTIRRKLKNVLDQKKLQQTIYQLSDGEASRANWLLVVVHQAGQEMYLQALSARQGNSTADEWRKVRNNHFKKHIYIYSEEAGVSFSFVFSKSIGY
jgi:hypothetical protein